MRVQNMVSNKGDSIANQFEITTDNGVYFQSYRSMIAFVPYSGPIQLDERFWDYSSTTGKYRNIFLNEPKKETDKKIANGTYILTNLNT